MTVNLEQELIRQNKKLMLPQELLVLREYEKNADIVHDDSLKRVGLDSMLVSGKNIADSKKKVLEETKAFKQDRVFHISQIKSLCEKYYLKFLPSEKYQGTVDNQLPFKITNFEAAYGVKCYKHNSFICAPPESFKLEEKPDDPLFFYQINDEYFYLIHKWGNDLSVTRQIKYFFLTRPLLLFFMLLAVTSFCISSIGLPYSDYPVGTWKFMKCVFICFSAIILHITSKEISRNPIKYRSPQKD